MANMKWNKVGGIMKPKARPALSEPGLAELTLENEEDDIYRRLRATNEDDDARGLICLSAHMPTCSLACI